MFTLAKVNWRHAWNECEIPGWSREIIENSILGKKCLPNILQARPFFSLISNKKSQISSKSTSILSKKIFKIQSHKGNFSSKKSSIFAISNIFKSKKLANLWFKIAKNIFHAWYVVRSKSCTLLLNNSREKRVCKLIFLGSYNCRLGSIWGDQHEHKDFVASSVNHHAHTNLAVIFPKFFFCSIFGHSQKHH